MGMQLVAKEWLIVGSCRFENCSIVVFIILRQSNVFMISLCLVGGELVSTIFCNNWFLSLDDSCWPWNWWLSLSTVTYKRLPIFSHSSVHSTASVSGESRGTGGSVQVSVSSRGIDCFLWLVFKLCNSTADTETVRGRRPSSPGEPATLTILATPQHNNFDVQCLTTIRNGIIVHVRSEASATATLTVLRKCL